MKLINMDTSTLIRQARKADANPGGGAILILTSNLAINLCLMMDKKSWADKEEAAKVSRETLLSISSLYEKLMQDDVDNFNTLMKAYKNDMANESHYLKSYQPLLTMFEKNLKAMDAIYFYLEHGRENAITDGQIANDLVYQVSLSAIPTIEINLKHTSNQINFDQMTKDINKKYERNKRVIERRMK